jgi:hypothetical protein
MLRPTVCLGVKPATDAHDRINTSNYSSVVLWSEFLVTDLEVRVRFPALPDFQRSSGSETGSTQPREYSRRVNGVICVAEKQCFQWGTNWIFKYYLERFDLLCGLVATDPEVWVWFLALPDFLRSAGSGTGSTQPRGYKEELLGRKSSGSGLGNREYGRRDPSRWTRGILYPQKLALTSPTSGNRYSSLADSFLVRQLRVCWCGSSPLTSGRLCQLPEGTE